MSHLNKLIEQRQEEVVHLFEVNKLLGKSFLGKGIIESKIGNLLASSTTQTATEAYYQALKDVLAGLPGEGSVYRDAHLHMTDRELRDEEMRVFGMNYRLQTIRAQIESLLSKE